MARPRRTASPGESRGSDPIRTQRVRCCHVCGSACGEVMCVPCVEEHLRVLQATLAWIRSLPRETRHSTADLSGTSWRGPAITPEKAAELAKEHAVVRARQPDLVRRDGDTADAVPF